MSIESEFNPYGLDQGGIVTVVPEPDAMLGLVAGIALLVVLRKNRYRSRTCRPAA